ncbi:MAG: glycosyltransferase [Candidatus Aminicenantes bacterium]|nr:MAG: glycosyltransferase [Candidatus Aminicenantes bacterium]
MKLIIQIPCYNEEETLESVIKDIPKKIQNIDIIETLIIDDGSTDKTVEVAKKLGVDHIVALKTHRGLAKAFAAGIEYGLDQGADIIVNTDGDNQYKGEDIPKLIMPIISGAADVVIGTRQIEDVPHFSFVKKKMQKLGSGIIRKLSKTPVKDATSGFRAFSKDAAMRINPLTEYSYTIESLVQLGNEKVKIVPVPIRVNPKLRESRLIKNTPSFVARQSMTLFRMYSVYKAFRVFLFLGILIALPGLIGFIRFLYFYFTSGGEGHVQSLIFSAVFIICGFFILMLGIIAELISSNRKMIEMMIYKIRKLEMNNKNRTKDED